MGARGFVALAVGAAAACALGGCASGRIESGVYHSSKGYRVALPGPEWTVREGGRADLELRHRASPAGMLANASCDGRADAVLAASIFHFAIHTIAEAKAYLRERGVAVRSEP